MKKFPWTMIVGALIAIGLFVAAGSLYRDSVRTRYRHVWQPMSMPLRLVAGEIESPEFLADKDVYYVVEIAPHGETIDEPHADMSWTISENEKAIAQGTLGRAFGGNSDERFLGSFRPDHNGRYRLHLSVRKIDTTGGTGPAELKVILDPGERSDIVDGAGLLEIAAGICGFLGLMALAFAITGVIVKRRKLAQLAHVSVSR
jgi:hypothetical protein